MLACLLCVTASLSHHNQAIPLVPFELKVHCYNYRGGGGGGGGGGVGAIIATENRTTLLCVYG